jgi:hypothetical protein
MGTIFFGIAFLAILVTGITEYRRHLRSNAATRYAKTGKKK